MSGGGTAVAGPGPVDRPRCELLTWEQYSAVLGCVKRADVLLPPGSDRAGRRSVLYLLHGFGATRETWHRRTRLVEQAARTGLVVVLPESGRRWFINDHRGHRYEDYLLTELLPAVEDRYLNGVSRGTRGIGGFSMGGAAALMLGLRRPELFSVVLSHAGAFEAPRREGDPYAELRGTAEVVMPSQQVHERVWGPPGSEVRDRYDLSRLLADLAPGPRPRVYADVGVGDYPRVLEMNRRAVQALRGAGIETSFQQRPGAHDLAYLDASLPDSLGFAASHLSRPGAVQ